MTASFEAAAEYFLQPAARPPLARRNHVPQVQRSSDGSSQQMHQRITKRIFGEEDCDHSLLRPGQPYREKPGSITEASLVLLMERKKRLEKRQRQQDLEEILFEINRQAVESESVAKQFQGTAGLPLPGGYHDKLRRSAYACLMGAHQLPDGRREDDDEMMPLPSRGLATSTSYSSDYQLLSTSSTYPRRRTSSALSSVKGDTPRVDQANRGGGIPRRSSSHSTLFGGHDIGSRGGSGGIGSLDEDPDGYNPSGNEAPFPITDWHGEMPQPLEAHDAEERLDPVAVHLHQRELDWNTSVVPDKPIADIYKKKHNEEQQVVAVSSGQAVSVQLPHVEDVLRVIKTQGIAAAEPRTATTQTVCALFTYGQPLQRSERLSVVAPILSRVSQPPKPKSYRAILEEKIAAGEIDLDNEEVRKVVSTLFEPEHASQPVRKKALRSQFRASKGLPDRSASAPLPADDPVLEDQRASSLSPMETPSEPRSVCTPASRLSTPAKAQEKFSRRITGASPLRSTVGRTSLAARTRHGKPDSLGSSPREQQKTSDAEPDGCSPNAVEAVTTVIAEELVADRPVAPDTKDHSIDLEQGLSVVVPPSEPVNPATGAVADPPCIDSPPPPPPAESMGTIKPAAAAAKKPHPVRVRPERTLANAPKATPAGASSKKLVASKPVAATTVKPVARGAKRINATSNEGTTVEAPTPSCTVSEVVRVIEPCEPTPPPPASASQPVAEDAAPPHAVDVVSLRDGDNLQDRSDNAEAEGERFGQPSMPHGPAGPSQEIEAVPQNSSTDDGRDEEGGYEDDAFEDASSPSPPRQHNTVPLLEEPSSVPPEATVVEPQSTLDPESYEDEHDTFEEQDEVESPNEEPNTSKEITTVHDTPRASTPPTSAVDDVRRSSSGQSSEDVDAAPEENYDDDEFDDASPSGRAEKMFEDIGGPGDDYSSDDDNDDDAVDAQQQPSTSESSLSVQQTHDSVHPTAAVPTAAPPADASEGDTYANALSVALRQRMKGKVSPRGASTAVVLSPPPEIYEALSGVTSRSVSAEPQQRPDSKHRRFSRGSTGGGDTRPQYTARDFFANNEDEASRGGRTASVAEPDDLSIMLPAQMRPTSRASTDNKSRTPPVLTPTASDGPFDWSRSSPPPDDAPSGDVSHRRESKKDKSKRKKSKDKNSDTVVAPAVVLDGFEEIDVGMPLKKGSAKRKKEKKSSLDENLVREQSTGKAPRETRSNRRSSNLGIALDL